MLKRDKTNKKKGEKRGEWKKKLMSEGRGAIQVLQGLEELQEMGEDGILCMKEG